MVKVIIKVRPHMYGLLIMCIPLPATRTTSHPRHSVLKTTQMCFNLISRVTTPCINFYRISCRFKNQLYSSQMYWTCYALPFFDNRCAREYTFEKMLSFADNNLSASVLDTVLKKLESTILTQVPIFEARNVRCPLNSNDRLSVDH